MREITHTPECMANHFGLYAIEPHFLSSALAAIQAGTYPINAKAVADEETGRELYQLTPEGIAVVQMSGPMMKGRSKFPHVNTIHTRRAVRAAVRAEDVGAILLHIDSPGGTVAGTQELADDIRAADGAKPVFSHIDDLGASAAYWAASQTRGISANRTAMVGSIGTVAVVDDFSKQFEMKGIETHVVSTGAYKGAFTQGAPVTEQHLAYLREEVEALNAHFQEAVTQGRGLRGKALEAVSDGRLFLADQALKLGLIDQVGSMDASLAAIAAQLDQDGAEARGRRMRMAAKSKGLR